MTMKTSNFNLANGASIELASMSVLINGEQQEIIPAFTEKSVQSKDLTKGDIAIDEDKLLPSLFCFADVSPYREQGVALFDANNTEIPQELPQDTPPVLVYLDKPDSVNLIRFVNNPVRAEIIHVDSVEDAMRRIALSNYVAKPMTKANWRSLAMEASDTLRKITDFAIEHKISAKTAQCYYGLNPSVSCLQKTAILGEDIIAGENPRDTESAQMLYQTIADKFGAKFARQTRNIKVFNACVNENGFDAVIPKIQALADDAVKEIKDASIDSETLSFKLSKFLIGKAEQPA